MGLLGPAERKNGWWLAEHAGHVSPDRMQRLLRTAVWDEDRAGDDLRESLPLLQMERRTARKVQQRERPGDIDLGLDEGRSVR